MIKKLTAAAVLILLCAVLPIHISAKTTYFNHTTRTEITRGVWLTESRRFTSSGLLDVFVLEVPLNDPYIELSVFNSDVEFGMRHNTARLINDGGAIAGINGDFFGLAGTRTFPLGIQVDNNGSASSVNDFNTASNNYATFYLDERGNPFIDFIRVRLAFINNGAENIRIAGLNTTVNVEWPVALTSGAMRCTTALNQRRENIVCIVVENGYITYISRPGENVQIPENGFVVAMPEHTFLRYAGRVAVGQPAFIDIQSSVDFAAINRAISGGGRILHNGAPSNEGNVPPGRHPRTAVGFTQDGQTAILMVVDGRSHSVGAIHADMALLMGEFGAFNAMHLDGGGSSTMVAAREPWLQATPVNHPADGAMRAVINALGVINNAPEPTFRNIVSFEIVTNDILTINAANPFAVWGRDEFRQRIALDPHDVVIIADGAYVRGDGMIVPHRENIRLWVSYSKTGPYLFSDIRLNARHISSITPAVRSLALSAGESASLSFTVQSTDGFPISVDINCIWFDVVPSYLGVVRNGVFFAEQSGQGFIRASINGAIAYIAVNTETAVRVPGFFRVNAPMLPTRTGGYALQMTVYGDGSGNLLYAVIREDRGFIRGVRHILPLTHLNFYGYREITVEIPHTIQHDFWIDGVFIEGLPLWASTNVRTSPLYILRRPAPPAAERPADTMVRTPLFDCFTAFMGSITNNHTTVNLNATNNGITQTNPHQWNTLQHALVHSGHHNIIIRLTGGLEAIPNPERSVLNNMMEQAALSGRTVLLVQNEGRGGSLHAYNGVWYLS